MKKSPSQAMVDEANAKQAGTLPASAERIPSMRAWRTRDGAIIPDLDLVKARRSRHDGT